MTDIDDLRRRLLECLPPLVCGMAEAIIAEWEQATGAVPELQRLAAEDLSALAALAPEERELALRRRWARLNDVPVVELPGIVHELAARPLAQPAMTTP